MDLNELETDALFAVARESHHLVAERAYPVARKVADYYCRKYKWQDPEELTHSLMLALPRIMNCYDPKNTAGNPWSKYLYFRLMFEGKDVLRREDPLGIGWPQKKQYPQWHRLGDEGLNSYEIEDIRDHELPEFDIVVELRAWQSVFAALPRPRKPKADRAWDKKRNRVKFRKNITTLKTWFQGYLRSKKPQQLTLGL